MITGQAAIDVVCLFECVLLKMMMSMLFLIIYLFIKIIVFSNPIKPLLMVETKNPVIIKDETFYQKLSDFVDANKSELLAEIRACKYVIFTDGITWMFLEERDGEIKEKYPSITLVDFHQAYYKTNYVTRKQKRRTG